MVKSIYYSCRGLKLAPSKHTGRLTTAYNSSCGASVTSGLHKYLHPCAHTYTQTRLDSYTEVTDRSLIPAGQSLNSGKCVPASRTLVCMQITWDLVKLLIQVLPGWSLKFCISKTCPSITRLIDRILTK